MLISLCICRFFFEYLFRAVLVSGLSIIVSIAIQWILIEAQPSGGTMSVDDDSVRDVLSADMVREEVSVLRAEISALRRLYIEQGERHLHEREELVAWLTERFREERVFREEFSHGLKREALQEMRMPSAARQVVPYAPDVPLYMKSKDGQRLMLDPAEPFMTLHIIEHGEWEEPVREALRKYLPVGGTFFDIGANIGLHSIYAAALVGPHGTIVAVEPHPRIERFLWSNVEINGLGQRVSVLRCAATDGATDIVSFDYFAEHPGMSGLKVPESRLLEARGSVETISVPTTTIDDLVKKHGVPDFIKIDVEGFESLVIRGAERTLTERSCPVFLLEWLPELMQTACGNRAASNIFATFTNLGYNGTLISHDGLMPISLEDAERVGGDILFVRN